MPCFINLNELHLDCIYLLVITNHNYGKTSNKTKEIKRWILY